MAERIRSHEPDVLAIGGDIAVPRDGLLAECLSHFASAAPTLLVVPGNHDLWVDGDGMDSLTRWEAEFPAAAAEAGFACLDVAPVVVNNVGFVGTIGWYDYSFASDDLPWTHEQYAAKELPGRLVWNDGRRIKWHMADAEFTEMVAARLLEHVAEVRDSVRSIVAVTHHLPFAEIMGERQGDARFVEAYLGSRALGDVLLSEPKVCVSLSGHSHRPARATVGHVRAIAVGSGYRTKRFTVLEVPN